jgi:hypothetical protein
MKKTSIFKWHTRRGVSYAAALILSDRHQEPERRIQIEVSKPWVKPLRISPTVVRRSALLASK